MRIVDSHYLDDGKGHNQGQAARLIHIEEPADYDRLLDNIIATNYYDDDYFTDTIGHQGHQAKPENLLVAALVESLGPGSVLELGCGRGDVLLFLALRGIAELHGMDLSADATAHPWPPLAGRLECGDVLSVCRRLAEEGRRFDTIVALDIWEHLPPSRLEEYIAAVAAVATEDALCFFVIPGFGDDRVFGEIFPLEFAENQEAMERGEPFPFLLAHKTDPPIPVSGHLIWAPSAWWEARLAAQGLVRVDDLERDLHKAFDHHLYYAQRAFFLLRRDTAAAQARAQTLLRQRINLPFKIGLLEGHLQAATAYAQTLGDPLLDPAKLHRDLRDCHRMVDQVFSERADRLVAKFLGRGSLGRWARARLQGPLGWASARYRRRRFPYSFPYSD